MLPGDSTRRHGLQKVVDFSKGALGLHVLRFGAPLVVAMAFMAAFNLIDIFIVGRLEDSHEAVTIVSVCDAVLTLFVVLCTGIGNAAVAHIARAVGNKDIATAREAAMQSSFIVGAISVMVFLVGVLAPGPLLQFLGFSTESRVYSLGIDYLRVAMAGGFTMFFVVHLTAVLRGIGNSMWPTVVLVLVNVLNILLAVLFVLGPDQGLSFGFGWGVMGAAWAALTGRIVGFTICVLLFMFGVGRQYIVRNPAHWRPDLAWIKKLLVIGLPSSGQLIVRVLAMLGLVGLIFSNLTTNHDTTIGTAFALCSKLELIALFMALGWGQAASTMVGQLLGAGEADRAARAGWISTVFCSGMVVVIGAVFFFNAAPIVSFFFSPETQAPPDVARGASPERAAAAEAALPAVMAEGIAHRETGRQALTVNQVDKEMPDALATWHRFFTDERYRGTPAAGEAWKAYKHTEHELVVYHGSWYIKIMVFAWVMMGIGIVLSQAMTGAGDARTPVLLDFSILIVIMLPVVTLVVNFTMLRQRTVWVAIALSYLVLAVCYALAFRRGKWKTHPVFSPGQAARNTWPDGAPAGTPAPSAPSAP